MKFTNSEEPKKVKILTANSKEISEHLVVPQGNDTMMSGDLLEISSSGNIIEQHGGTATNRNMIIKCRD